MNRQIKFRGKRVDNGEWVYGFYRKNTIYHKFSSYNKEDYTKHFIGCFDNLSLFDGIFEQVEVIPETVGQFTGLKDRKGNEIWEGDYSQEFEVVIWCDICCGWQLGVYDIPTKDFIYCHNCEGNYMIQDSLYHFEVIGNIHDNTDLLTK